jgi:hypothetical protein
MKKKAPCLSGMLPKRHGAFLFLNAVEDAVNSLVFIAGDQNRDILRVKAGFFADVPVPPAFGAQPQRLQPFQRLFAGTVAYTIPDFLFFLIRESVRHVSAPK